MNRSRFFTFEYWLACWKSPLFLGGLIVLTTLLAYLPATRGGYIWDDDVYVTDNTLLTAPDGLRRIWFSLDSPSQYFPLVYTTFRMERPFWGLDPAGYHRVNILFHIANALLVWLLLSRLKVPGAWLAAMIFAVHPVQVESVAWITERKNVLMLFFFLLSLLAWTGFIDSTAKQRWRFYVLALVFHALALFSKTTACTLPAALVLILWLRHKPVDMRRWVQVVPFLALGAGMGMLTVWWERYHQGTQGKLFALGLPERVIVASHAVWFYGFKLLWPAALTFSYPHWTLHPWNPVAYGWLFALVVLCWAIYCAREDFGRSVEVAAVYFVATLFPVLGFIMLYTFRYSFVADHYQYAACIGPIALVSAGAAQAFRRFEKMRVRIGTAIAFVLVALGFLTWRQCHIYRDAETLWRDTIAKNPGSLMGHFNLGNDLMRRGDLPEALEHYTRAVAIDPGFVEARGNRGQVLVLLGRLPEAAADFSEALKIDPGNAVLQNDLGDVLKQTGELDEAIVHYREAARLNPHYTMARKNLGEALVAGGRFAEALPDYQEVARQLPDSPQSHYMLAHIYLALGKTKDAIREYRENIRLDPQSSEPLAKLAYLLATSPDSKLRNSAEAIQFAGRACDLTHYDNVYSLGTLAAAYASDGRFADAVGTCLSALEIARHSGQPQLAATLQKQLESYQAGRPLAPPAR